MTTMERPPLHTDVFGFPLAAAGPLPDSAYCMPMDEPHDMLSYGKIDYCMSMRDPRAPLCPERQAVALSCTTEVALEHGDKFSYFYIVLLTGTTGSPVLGDWAQWTGLKHLVGNVFHASGWMPWTKDSDHEMNAWRWCEPITPMTEPLIELPVPATTTSTEEPAS